MNHSFLTQIAASLTSTASYIVGITVRETFRFLPVTKLLEQNRLFRYKPVPCNGRWLVCDSVVFTAVVEYLDLHKMKINAKCATS